MNSSMPYEYVNDETVYVLSVFVRLLLFIRVFNIFSSPLVRAFLCCFLCWIFPHCSINIIIIIIIIIITYHFIQSIYTYIPEANNVSTLYSAADIL